MPTIEELKEYLGIDGGHNDRLLADFLGAAKEIVEKILRYKIEVLNPLPSAVKEALRYAVAIMYENREQADILQLEKTIATLLQGLRKKEF